MTQPSATLQKINRAELCEALRSDKFAQGTKFILVRTSSGAFRYCCLGVACEVSSLGNWMDPTDVFSFIPRSRSRAQSYRVIGGEKHEISLPESVRAFYGFKTDEGRFMMDEWFRMVKLGIVSAADFIKTEEVQQFQDASLAELNDFGVSFKTIANIIEFEPKGLIEWETLMSQDETQP